MTTRTTDNNTAPHICTHSACDCGMSRRDFLRISALATASVASPLLLANDARAQQLKTDDQPVKIGYLPITDATPLLVAHANKLYEQQGLTVEAPRMFRSWAQIVEAFVAGQVNVIHLLSPAALWVRYGSKFPAKIVAWNHMNGSALTVGLHINKVSDLGGTTVAIPFWYSIHNILLQQLLLDNKLRPVTRARGADIKRDEVNLVILPPAEMVSALAAKSISGFIVADPFNAAAEANGIGKVLRMSGDIWQNHACCVTFLSERDIHDRPEWTQRVTNALVQAQLWTRGHRAETAQLLSRAGDNRYTPHTPEILGKVFTGNPSDYVQSGAILHPTWQQKRIDFQPYPFASYTEELVRAIKRTQVEGDTSFLAKLDPKFVARDLVDDRFVRKAIDAVGGPSAFGLPKALVRNEIITVS